MTDRLRVALVGGPMYDAVYEPFIDDVEVVVHADHLTLNTRVAELLAAGERIDVLSTHGKYAPSQRRWLRPLDDLLDPATIAALAPGAVELCLHDGDLLCAPRNVDVRVLWWRTDRMDAPPETWADLLAADTVFGFTGRGSGLFGLFYELVVGAGGRLFDEAGAPALDPGVAADAIDLIAGLAPRCPAGPQGIVSWHYDEVDAALGAGTVDCAAAWPGATASLLASDAGPHLRPAPYLAGPTRRASYSGCHGWAIPTTCADPDRAAAFVEALCSPEFQRIEASLGGIPARTDVLTAIEPTGGVDAERLEVTRATIADSMITYPPMERFPLLEDDGAAAITAVIAGTGTVDAATETIADRVTMVAEAPT